MTLEMLKKRLGLESIERGWYGDCLNNYYKIPTTLNIPDSCEKIGMCAFWGCKKLREVTIPKSVRGIGYNAFWGCYETKIILEASKNFYISSNFEDCKEVIEI